VVFIGAEKKIIITKCHKNIGSSLVFLQGSFNVMKFNDHDVVGEFWILILFEHQSFQISAKFKPIK